MSAIREECTMFIERWASLLPKDPEWILDIGVAGDPKPGGNYYLFNKPGQHYKTLDCDWQYEPDYLGDLTMPKTLRKLKNKFDVVICSNVLEHIFDYKAAFEGLSYLLKAEGYLIVDCPWMYPYHAEDQFGDYWRISATAMERLINQTEGLTCLATMQGEHCTSAFAKKKLL